MARLRGVVGLEGKLGDVVFCKTKYGVIARTLGRPKKKPRVAAGESRKQDVNTEFGYASRIGKLMRVGVRQGMPYMDAGSTYHRLNGELHRLVRKDTKHIRGERRLSAGVENMLTGFSWRENSSLVSHLWSPYTIQLDPQNASASLGIAKLVPAENIHLGDGATHANITLVVVAVNDDDYTQSAACISSEMIELKSRTSLAISLNATVENGSGRIMIAGFGVQAYEPLGGELVAMNVWNGFEILRLGFRD